ncbi:MAG: NERD domain-containing protein [Pyrinomonadaceae bacterium]
MARMIPPYPSIEIKSTAERKIFELFRNDPETKNWVILHSLGLTRHIKRQYGEIDFVVLVPDEGVFCLEVKGGRIKREEGVWTFTDRHGNTNSKALSPFSQAREGMFSLLKAVTDKFGNHHRLSNLVFRYGVLFPDIEFIESSTEFEKWEIFDLRDKRFPINRYVKKLSKGAHKQVKSTGWYNAKESRPSEKDVNELVKFLRGDFEKIPPPLVQFDETEKELFTLTGDQYECLDNLDYNERCLFDGGAGTGKTMLATEFASREAAKGKMVGFFCYNKFLGLHLKQTIGVRGTAVVESVTTGSLHKYIRNLILNSVLKEEFLAEESANVPDLYKEKYPIYGAVAVRGNIEFEQFDTLIIDEAQDVINPNNLDFFEEILKGGLAGGKWAIFADFHRQAIYSAYGKGEIVNMLKQRAPNLTVYRLLHNCRNTKYIGEETASVSGFKKPPFLPSAVNGQPVDYQFYTDDNDQVKRIETILKKLADKRIPPQKITILSTKAIDKSCFNLLKALSSFGIEEISAAFFEENYDKTTFATVHSFKGLENSVIILTDAENLTESEARSLLYVGMSRARLQLYMLISKTLKKQYDLMVAENIAPLITKK